MKRLLGVLVLAMGVLLAGWVVYNLFVQHLPETRGRSPFSGLGVAIAFIYVGVMWMRGKTAG